MDFTNLELKRFTVHKIMSRKDLKGKKERQAYAVQPTGLGRSSKAGLGTFNARITAAAAQVKRFFELDLAGTGPGSFWHAARNIFDTPENRFIEIASGIAGLAAAAHDKGNIPGGLLLVAECLLGDKSCLAIVKAERTEAFSLSGSNMQLIEDLFLSSDKTLFKIGFLVKTRTNAYSPAAFKCYVYDDSFSAAKEDLAFYFYSKFLGFSTEKNSKLATNNFYRYFIAFVEEFIQGFGDRNSLISRIDYDLLSTRKKILNPENYAALFPEELHGLYRLKICDRVPRAFIKDTSIVAGIASRRLRIDENAVLLAKNGIAKDLAIVDNLNSENFQATKKALFATGKTYKAIFIPVTASPEKTSKTD